MSRLSIGELLFALLVDGVVANNQDDAGDDSHGDEAQLQTMPQFVSRAVDLAVEVGCHGLIEEQLAMHTEGWPRA